MAELRYVDWDGLVYYDGKIKEYIRDAAESYLKMGGIVTFEELPDPSWTNLNYIYKVTDPFISNDRFSTEGVSYKENTWVQVHDFDGTYLYIIFNEEIIGQTAEVDLSNYYTKIEVEDLVSESVSDFYTKEEIDNKTADLVTETELKDAFAIELRGTSDLSENGVVVAFPEVQQSFELYSSDMTFAYGVEKPIITMELSDNIARVGDIKLVSNELSDLRASVESNYITTETANNTYATITTLENEYVKTADAVTKDEVQNIVTQEVQNVVEEELETKVQDIIEDKISSGEIEVSANKITYGEF